MRLIVCRLCTGDDPFACPVKFRRTYMQLHLEKSHAVVARGQKILRTQSQQTGAVADWVAVKDGSRRLVLTELEIDVGSSRQEPVENSSGGMKPGTAPEPWSASAMRGLYRSREGVNTVL